MPFTLIELRLLDRDRSEHYESERIGIRLPGRLRRHPFGAFQFALLK